MSTAAKPAPIAVPQKKIVADLTEIIDTNLVEYVEIEGFNPGQVFRIVSLTAGEFIEWTEAKSEEQKKTAGLRLIAKSLVGPPPANERYADGDKAEMTVAVLRTKSQKVTNRIVKEILKLNGLDDVKKRQEDAKND